MMIDVSEQHFVAVPSQSSIYGLTTLEVGRCSKTMALVASCSSRTSSRVFLVSVENYVVNREEVEDGGTDNDDGRRRRRAQPKVNPVSREIHFTYIPGGAEIISIDSFNKSSSGNDFVVGITFSKPGDPSSMQYFNVYTDWEETKSLSLESIPSCISLKLNFMPYHLYHTEIRNPVLDATEIDWLLSGGDGQIHLYREDTQQHTYCEHDLDDYFPEFIDLRRIVLWMDVVHYQDSNDRRRLAVVGCEDGYVRATITRIADDGNEVLSAWDVKHDSPISRVTIFSLNAAGIARPAFLDRNSDVDGSSSSSSTASRLHVLVASTLEMTVVYWDVVATMGFTDQRQLPCSDHFDCVQCACVTDVDFDGQNEILLGTYGQEMLIYKCSAAGEFSLIKQRSFAYPLLSIDYVDITGDGLNELVVLSTKGLHILQHDLNEVSHLLIKRLALVRNVGTEEQPVERIVVGREDGDEHD